MSSEGVAKSDMQVGQAPIEAGDGSSSTKGGTADDQADMFRMGKVQELKVCYHPHQDRKLASRLS